MENMKSISIKYTNRRRNIERTIFQLLKLMWVILAEGETKKEEELTKERRNRVYM